MAAVKTKAKTKTKTKATARKKLDPIPKGYHSVTPYMVVDGAAAALDFYKKAFGAKERARMPGEGGKIMHCEFEIGDSVVMMADEFPEMGARSPKHYGGSPVTLHVYVTDVDAMFKRAVAAGASVKSEPKDQFYGDRSCGLADPFGHVWHLSTHVEEVSMEEMKRRMAGMKK